jgi:hypothetical protein
MGNEEAAHQKPRADMTYITTYIRTAYPSMEYTLPAMQALRPMQFWRTRRLRLCNQV